MSCYTLLYFKQMEMCLYVYKAWKVAFGQIHWMWWVNIRIYMNWTPVTRSALSPVLIQVLSGTCGGKHRLWDLQPGFFLSSLSSMPQSSFPFTVHVSAQID